MNINWEMVIGVALVVVLLLAGGYIRKLLKEIKELIDCIVLAIQDDKVDDTELAQIIKEMKDVGASVKEIVMAIASLRKP